jgi:putative component of membrane protein insertase Oxa1/YidC/SpoIIIJ protein YidD
MTTAAWLIAFPLSALLYTLIELYQRYVSPYKGFRCAYRAHRGRHSCSEFGKRAILRGGVTGFWPLLRRRFARCAEAAKLLKARRAAIVAASPAAPPVLDYESKANREEEASRRSKDGWGDCVGEGCLHGCDVGSCEVGSCDVGDAAGVADAGSCAVDTCPADACGGV